MGASAAKFWSMHSQISLANSMDVNSKAPPCPTYPSYSRILPSFPLDSNMVIAQRQVHKRHLELQFSFVTGANQHFMNINSRFASDVGKMTGTSTQTGYEKCLEHF